MLNRRTFSALAGVAFAALLATSAQAQNVTLRSTDIHPTDYPTVEAVRHMGKLLEERTKGRIKINVFHSAQLGQEKDTIEQTRFGVIDMNRINMAPFNNLIPATNVPSLPFIFRSVEHMRKVMDGKIGDDLLKEFEKHDLIGLAFYDSGSRSFYNSKKAINSPADMKGMKIRVQQSDLFVSMIEALGANPTPMPMGEVYTGLKTGIIDAAENNYPSYESSRHFEAAKYYTRTEHAMAPEVLVFSKTSWDRLSKDDQAAIRKAAKDSVPHMRKLWAEREEASRAIVEKAGTQIGDVANKQEFVNAMKPVFAKFANTPKLQGLVQRIQDTK